MKKFVFALCMLSLVAGSVMPQAPMPTDETEEEGPDDDSGYCCPEDNGAARGCED